MDIASLYVEIETPFALTARLKLEALRAANELPDYTAEGTPRPAPRDGETLPSATAPTVPSRGRS
jgi:hypothetical protein